MKKTTTPQPDVWGAAAQPTVAATTESAPEILTAAPLKLEPLDSPYDLDGLMTDFPTAGELQKFVYDQTGIALQLKGRANKLKYQVAMDVLNGVEVGAEFRSSENPYVDRNDMVPVEPIRDLGPRDPSLPPLSEVQNVFHSMFIPHPDPNHRAQDKKVTVAFRKYRNGCITYQVEGPMSQTPIGEKIDKYGKNRPEIIAWVDPRTQEQIIIRPDGSTTPQGQKLRALMKTHRVNNSNVWDTWIDREFVSLDGSVIDNPWA
jgi:hypothetical protein